MLINIKGVELAESAFTLYQESDTNDNTDTGQYLKVYTMSNGFDYYICIESERWAIDYNDIDKFAEMLKNILKMTNNEGDNNEKMSDL